MKLIHLFDLHLGKKVNEFSMLDDQAYILREIVRIVDDEQPHGVIVAGDIYDKSVPPAEAATLFDEFLVALAERGVPVFLISGNHDSAERLAFGGRLMDQSGVHFAPLYNGTVAPLTLRDGDVTVRLYLLPFLKPAHVRRFFPDDEIVDYTDAMRVAVAHMPLDPAARNELVTHQFVTGAERSESEEISVGGTDNVDASVFEPFDYVALGHIHRPQNIGSPRIRYCGTPLKYSFSECNHEKSVTVVELPAVGDVTIRTVPLRPLHDMRELRGTYNELTARAFYDGTSYPDEYLHITLTDEEDVPDAMSRLRVIYKRLMKLDYDNTRTRHAAVLEAAADVERQSPLELFSRFYEQQNGAPMSEEQTARIAEMIEDIWEGAV